MNLARFVFSMLFLIISTEAIPQNIKLNVDKGLLAVSYADRSDKEYPFPENIPLFSFHVNDSIYSISDATIHRYDEGYSFSFQDNITGEIIRDTDETRGWACRIIIRNNRLDTVYVENVVPFGESGGHIYLTSTGPWALARAKLFRPGLGPVGVILPDNAWEMGYGSVVLDDDISACAIARRVRSEKAEWRRYRTILFPEGWVEYVFYADDYAGEWQNGLRLMFRDRWLYDLEDFDETLYHRDDLKWIRNKYLIGLQFAWNQEYYEWKTQQYHLEDFLQKGQELFGGYDVFGLWPTWPRLGVDQRNQWDLFTDLPGGLETLRKMKPDGVKLFICYNPWDESTRAEDPYDGLAKLIEATDADGVVLDCHGASSFELQRAADSIKPGVVMYSEGMAVVKDMPGIVSGRVHDAIHLPPPLNLNKLIRPDFAIFRVCQIRDGRIKREASIAFFNGYGTELNTFAPGRLENMEEDLRYLGRTTLILRENTSNFLVNDWTPLLPTLHDSIWVNKWPLGEKTIFTLFSLVPEGYRGPLFEESGKEGYRLVSLWHHEELEWEEISGKSYIPVKTEAFNRFELNTRAEGNIDCIALLPKRITAEIQGGVLHLSANEGDQLIVWAGNPSYQNVRKLALSPGEYQVDLMQEIFGRHEGKYVIQLFGNNELMDEAVVYLIPGTPRLIGQQAKTPLVKKAPDDMVFIPGGTFSFKAENTDQFIPYPDSKEPVTMTMEPFFMDKYPVTNKQFLGFLKATGYAPADPVNFLKHWENGMIPAGLENHPVVYVSLEDARAYTAWAGKRLPTEAEWQYAAQGKKNLLWPWGNEYDSTRCNHSTGKTTPVDAFPGGKSPFGAMDMTGNVWQLTGDVYDNGTYYFVIMKGGSHYQPTSSWWYVKGGPQPNTWHQQLLLVSPSFDRNATVGFRCVKDHDESISMSILIENPEIKADPEFLALQSFLMTVSSSDLNVYTLPDLPGKKNIFKETDILWFYKNDTMPSDDRKTAGAFDVLRQFIENGGKMILANQAAMYLSRLGLEVDPPVTRLKPSKDQGYGRQLGYHAFREHPLFAGMHGGAYVLKPLADTTVWQTGYFGDGVPVAGKVVAVDWDYIFLRESSRLIFEYEKGKGKVMAVGGYLLFSLPNRNRAHLELFTENLIYYLLNADEEKLRYFWSYESGVEIERTFEMGDWWKDMGDGRWTMDDFAFGGHEDALRIIPGKSSGNYWDLSGERMLVMGTDHGGITEIWAHPVLCLREYRVDVRLGMQQDTMPDFRSIRPEIEVRPACYFRKYDLAGNPDGPRLEERITVSPDKPVAVINYRYDGRDTAEFRVSFRLMFRLMWPYSEKVLGNTYYSWDEELKAYIVTDQSGDFVTIAGVGVPRDSIPVITGTPSLSALITLTLHGPSTFNMIIASSSEGLEKTLEYYRQALAGPGAVFEASAAHAQAILDNSLIIEGPVQDFNDGYRWALLATDRFHVATPGVGSSLVAGYATSDKGWDGEHAVSGRPGYGWYFGRDGAWSGFALLHYGDFKKARLMLKTFQRYQDLTGKIFHELSTSGIVHYDAADATPLYIVLAGRYLRHSGDTGFIRSSWPHIKKAIDFCYSTDTDGDLLIENTNVGHGWVEGGHLFGSHTSLHLASVWAAALEEAAYMASHLDLSDEFVRFNQDAHRVREIINRDFWNAQNDYYYHGLMADGTYMEETSIMPAIPMLFGQADPEKAEKVLPVIAANAFTADWGCRIVPEHDPRFNPRGYHTGSVWPLFTGWASLAEFRNNNYLQGFAHLSSNLEIWKYWGLGFMEEVLNGEIFQPSGVCHHQCWSETMALQPVIEGMLGYRPDAVNRKIYLKPWFPADWESVSVKGIRVGEEEISMLVQSEIRHSAKSLELSNAMNVTRFSFAKEPGERLDVHLQPVLPPGSKVGKITVNDLPARDWGVRETPQGWVIPEFGFWLDGTAVVEITWHGGIIALPLLSHPLPGERSKGFRIIGTRYDNGTYTVILQAPRASRQEFRVWAAEPEKCRPEGAEIINISGHIITLAADFPDLETDYAVKHITLEYISD